MTNLGFPGIRAFEPVAVALAKLLHPHAEVVIHDLESGNIGAIFNAFSRRQVGDDSLIEDPDLLGKGPEVHGPHEKRLFDGRRIKYVSSLLKNDAGKAVGLLCINLDVSLFEQLETMIQGFLRNTGDSTQLDELFEDDWQDRINSFVSTHLGEQNLNPTGLRRADRGELVRALHAAGAFRATGAADYVARVLSVSRATVYNDLAQGPEAPTSQRTPRK
jgi:predicted transcriptional regulator YheO